MRAELQMALNRGPAARVKTLACRWEHGAAATLRDGVRTPQTTRYLCAQEARRIDDKPASGVPHTIMQYLSRCLERLFRRALNAERYVMQCSTCCCNTMHCLVTTQKHVSDMAPSSTCRSKESLPLLVNMWKPHGIQTYCLHTLCFGKVFFKPLQCWQM